VISKASQSTITYDFQDKIELVKEIIVNLANALLANSMQSFAHVPIERFLEKEHSKQIVSRSQLPSDVRKTIFFRAPVMTSSIFFSMKGKKLRGIRYPQ
jgi:hypothetical protein